MIDRSGSPSPLPLHLHNAHMTLLHACMMSPVADQYGLAPHQETPAQGAVLIEGLSRLRKMLDGIDAYQGHPFERRMSEPPVIWSEGSTRLLDYGQSPEATHPSGPAILVLPSMINRAYVLDLTPERTFLRQLAAKGLRPLLLDWGAPGLEERGMSLDEMLSKRLRPALAIARAIGGQPALVLGYCMGGTLGTALAANASADVRALITIGAPWAFDQRIWSTERLAEAFGSDGGLSLRLGLRSMGAALGVIPNILFQSLFANLDPTGALRKFRQFSEIDPTSDAARHFVAVEDWLNAGPDVPTAIAETVLVDWHLLNTPGKGQWRALGRPVDPSRITQPALCLCAPSDRIAPPGSTSALASAIPDATLLRPKTGHVGMVVGRCAQAEVIEPIAAFCAKLG
ncbi:MAG: alpha/beta fold hydrolase [Pseudomonadota bacterium]